MEAISNLIRYGQKHIVRTKEISIMDLKNTKELSDCQRKSFTHIQNRQYTLQIIYWIKIIYIYVLASHLSVGRRATDFTDHIAEPNIIFRHYTARVTEKGFYLSVHHFKTIP